MGTFSSANQINDRIAKATKAILGFQSATTEGYRLGTYKHFGHGRYSYELARDLLKFRDETLSSANKDAKFWAIFEQSDDLSAAEFEKCLHNELEATASHPEFAGSWEPHTCADSDDQSIYFKLDGTAFCVSGLHPHSPESESRFMYPAMVFTICNQFDEQVEAGKYLPMAQPKTATTGFEFFDFDLAEGETAHLWQYSSADIAGISIRS